MIDFHKFEIEKKMFFFLRDLVSVSVAISISISIGENMKNGRDGMGRNRYGKGIITGNRN